MRLMVRGKELHCRQGWGKDHWDVVNDDVVLDVRVREPDSAAGSGGLTDGMTRDARRAAIQSAEAVICAWSAEPASHPASEPAGER